VCGLRGIMRPDSIFEFGAGHIVCVDAGASELSLRLCVRMEIAK